MKARQKFFKLQVDESENVKVEKLLKEAPRQSAAKDVSRDRAHHENNGFVYANASFSNFHLHLPNDWNLKRYYVPIGILQGCFLAVLG